LELYAEPRHAGRKPLAEAAERRVIAQVRGRLLRKGPQEAIVDVAGVGYRITIPLSTFYGLGEPGAEVTLLTHTHVREDTLALFGFLTAVEQALFERLIAVSGVGPKLAVGVLSGIEAPELVAALRAGDHARLTRIPGVGKKTAERLVVELKDKMQDLPSSVAAPDRPGAATDDLVSALVHLGYSRPEAERGVERAVREHGEGRFEDLLRIALQAVSRR
jgi:Holliday junction DNA helicase RuvA